MEFKELKKILNANREEYTDEQIREIGEFTTMFADIIVSNNLLKNLGKAPPDNLMSINKNESFEDLIHITG